MTRLEFWRFDTGFNPYIRNSNLNSEDVQLYVRPGFWCDVAKAWASINFASPKNKMQIMQQSIWYNSHIRIEGKPAHNEVARSYGIITIQDLYINGHLRSFAELQSASNYSIKFMQYMLHKILSTYHGGEF